MEETLGMGQRSQGSLGSAMTPATAVIPDLGTNGDHGQAADKMIAHGAREAKTGKR